MSGLPLVLACTVLLAAVLLALHLRPAGRAVPGLRRAHQVLAAGSLAAWVGFLVVAGRLGDLAGSVVGIVGLTGWWCVGVGGLLLAAREQPGVLRVLGHVLVGVLVGVLSWAYAVDAV